MKQIWDNIWILFFSGEASFSWFDGHWPPWMLFLKYYKQSSKLFPDITTKIFDLMVLCFLLVFLGSRVFYQWNVEISWDTNIWCVPSKDHVYRMVIVEVKQYLTKPNHCIWPIRTHYTFVSTNEQFAPNEDDIAMVQRPSTITILYIWSLPLLVLLPGGSSKKCQQNIV